MLASDPVPGRFRHLRRAGRLGRPVASILGALAFLIVADRAIAFGLGQLVLQSGNRVAMIYGGRARAQVVVFGNSVADAMTTAPLLSSRTNKRVYMAAVHGLDAATQKIIVEDYLDRHPKPEVAILEHRVVSDGGGVLESLSPFAYQSARLRAALTEARQDDLPWDRLFQLANFNSRELAAILTRVATGPDQSRSASNGTITPARIARFRDSGRVRPTNARYLTAFVETIALLEARGVRVIVVAAPLHPVTREKTDQTERNIQAMRDALPPHIQVFDQTSFVTDDRHFEDPTHMNEAGRRVFTEVLALAVAGGQI